MNPRTSIRKKLVVVVMATTFAALLVSVGLIIAYDLRSYHRSLLNDLSTQAELVGHMTSAALAFDDPRLAGENLALLRTRPIVEAAAIYDETGRLFASYSARKEAGVFPPRPQSAGVQSDGQYVALFRPIVENGETVGTVWLRAENRMLARTLDYLAIALGVMLLAMGTAWLVMRRMGGVITAPIVAVTEIARDVVATRDYSRRAPRVGDDEAAELADSFNAMLTEIEQRTRELEDSNAAIVRGEAERSRSQQEVMRLNEQLEQRVDERTLQLALANAELANAIDEARKANQAKSAFLSSMSHELRTPLNAILGFAQILTSQSLPTSEAQKKEFASHILKSGRHLLTLINEILDLAKVESGTITLSMEPVALGEILDECQSMIEPLAAARGIRMLFPQQVGAVLLADRTRLKQVLLNLLSNAIKYNRDAGAVVLDCAQAGPNRLRISIQDTGMGLRPEQVDNLFQPFNRLGQEAGAQEGTGIGLVVTRRLVELMDGTIDVSSSPGVGSVFTIELGTTAPLTTNANAGVQREAAAATGASDASHLLLYVEDNPANLKLVEEIVRFRPDLRLLAAGDGPLGLSLARAHHPEIILMDVNLPGMSGLEVLAQLQREPATKDIPVIALTANAMPRDVERGIAAGFFRYLTKPIDIDQFNEVIDVALAHRHGNAEGGAA
ncbi:MULTISPECIES: ATP-binding protein [unclassified Massilia]|uniref:ATP-binding protein n=1 Tax=unclassified Massilia TaxID=2609279 RepID=UPI00177EFF0F|nr:response regulator [Massilia sp. CFBP 13647]MBD8676223.1 response regulator [Massilia sp. CFBP 13721]